VSRRGSNERLVPAQMPGRCGRGEPSPGEQMGGSFSVPAQQWHATPQGSRPAPLWKRAGKSSFPRWERDGLNYCLHGRRAHMRCRYSRGEPVLTTGGSSISALRACRLFRLLNLAQVSCDHIIIASGALKHC
jgi:hypothetical protein